jgi:hypothetical protein
MKAKVKTPLITLEIEDETIEGRDGFTKRGLPEFNILIQSVITEAIRLHKEVSLTENKNYD